MTANCWQNFLNVHGMLSLLILNPQYHIKINDAIIENMLSWHHSGFNVYIGDRIEPGDKTGLGNLARYIIRTCFER